MPSNERKIVLSTDCAGVFGSPRVWEQVWQPTIDALKKNGNNFAGYEMVGWGGKFMGLWTATIFNQAHKNGHNVVGIHGRTGGNQDSPNFQQSIKSQVLRSMLIPTPDLVRHYGTRVNYVLVHTPEARSGSSRKFLENCDKSSLNLLMVENHVHPKGMELALDTANSLNKLGLKTGAMFDVFHSLDAHCRDSNLDTAWKRTINELENILGSRDENNFNQIPLGVHLPIGHGDGIPGMQGAPIEHLTDLMLQELAAILNKKRGIPIILENQQGGLDKLYLTQKAIAHLQERNAEVVERLIKNEVL